MSIASEILRLQQAKAAILAAISNKKGVPVTGEPLLNEVPPLIDGIGISNVYEVGATTVRVSADQTENVATNDLLRIYGDDGKAYTLAEWNALFVEAGYSTTGMPTPVGFVFTKHNGGQEVIYFGGFDGRTWRLDGSAAGDDKSLQHSPYNTLTCITAAASGTDAITGKDWSITSDDETDEWVLYTDNTKTSFRIPKGIDYGNAWDDSDNFVERTESLYQITEWYRHRFAINSGIATAEENGETTTVEILNASGEQAAAGEDMTFWIGGTDTNIQAKYNANNLHGGNATSGLTDALRTTLYGSQKTNGVNMNDTGVNSASKPVLGTGSKGAEAVAVDGYWYIITPYVTQAANATNQFADAPAVYYAKSLGLSLPSQEAVELLYFNKTIADAMRSYLVNKEGRTITDFAVAAHWCAGRYSTNNAWYINTSNCFRYFNTSYNRYRAVGASGL